MRNPILILILFIMLVYSLYLSYVAWFKSDRYLKQWQQGRNRIKGNFSFLPNFFIEGFLIGPRSITLWWARIGYLIFVLICAALLLFVSFGSGFELP